MLLTEVSTRGTEGTQREAVQTLEEWARERCGLLSEDGATTAMVDGYLNCAFGLSPNLDAYVGDPFGANDYHEGYALATYEIGPASLEVVDDGLLAVA